MCFKDSIITETDSSYGMIRIEILCKRCGSHLGHIFNDGHHRTNQRHCVNSLSIMYIDQEPPEDAQESQLDLQIR